MPGDGGGGWCGGCWRTPQKEGSRGREARWESAWRRDTPWTSAPSRFDYPLALTSLIGLTTASPCCYLLHGRSPLSGGVAGALSGGRWGSHSSSNALGLSFKEAAIAWLGSRGEHAGNWPGLPAGWPSFGSSPWRPSTHAAAMSGSSGWRGLPPELAATAVTGRVRCSSPALAVSLALPAALLVAGPSHPAHHPGHRSWKWRESPLLFPPGVGAGVDGGHGRFSPALAGADPGGPSLLTVRAQGPGPGPEGCRRG